MTKISKIINTKFKFLEKNYLNEEVVRLFNSDSAINDLLKQIKERN